jgi:hypothetical protein
LGLTASRKNGDCCREPACLWYNSLTMLETALRKMIIFIKHRFLHLYYKTKNKAICQGKFYLG